MSVIVCYPGLEQNDDQTVEALVHYYHLTCSMESQFQSSLPQSSARLTFAGCPGPLYKKVLKFTKLMQEHELIADAVP